MRLLVVCLGNICRSPMAEGALRHRIAEAGLQARVVVDSAGTGDWHAGQPPDARAVATAARHGVDIGALRARQLRAGDFARFDWLLCADRTNLRDVQALAPAAAQAKPVLLLEWAGVAETREVPDPYTEDEPEFERAWALVDSAARGTVARLRRPRACD
ncbi:MAG: low molecular weight phosphotyrosine protein phosphatase [Pseudomonadota bacterium]|nr:low molecular weight phosphotyrosine protein phosphatase [Pseudomonadota bacterium]